MSTVAGSSSVGDGLLGTEAFLVAPTFVKMVNGELFICDSGTIRKLLTNGTIISVVSDLKVSGDVNAPLASGLDFAANGDIYVADYNNHRIKKVSSGIVSVFAGTGNQGVGTDGNLAINTVIAAPHSIAFHPITGELYFSQPVANKIRKIGTDNIVSTVAGTSSGAFGGDGDLAINAKLFVPNYIAFDASGNLFISDAFNKRIRKVTYSDGKISTFAGGSDGSGGDDAKSFGFSYPSGIAVNPSNGDVYIGDRVYNSIFKVSNGKISSIAGAFYNGEPFTIGDGGLAVDAYLKDPAGLCLNSNSELFIVDSGNFRIRKVATSGYISTIVGGGIGDGKSATEYGILRTPKDVILAENGVDLLIADYENGRVRKVSNNIISTIAGDQPTTSADGSLATKTRIIGLESIALAPNGDLYLVEQSRIRKISKSDGKIYTVAGTSIVGNSPDGSVASTSQIGILKSIAFNSLGEVVFTDYWNDQIRKVSSGGLLVTLPNQSNTRFGSLGLRGLAINSKDEIIFADINNYVITKITQNGQFITLAGTGSPGYDSPDGNLATSTAISPLYVALNFKGEVIFSDESQRIRKISTDGRIVSIAGKASNASFSGDGGLASNAFISSPMDLTVDSNGHILFADSNNNRIRKITYTCPDNYALVSLECIPICFGIYSNNQSVCLSRGQCNEPNQCTCNTPYYGTICEMFDCYGVPMNSSKVCSSHGTCPSPNNCSCSAGYYGNNCESFDCYGVVYNSSRVCSSHGECTLPNKCECKSGYYGNNCETYYCSGILFNSSQVCSSHGSCASPNNCSCSAGYYGSECEHYQCNGIYFNSSQVCSSRGSCISPDNCTCSEGYYGKNCELFDCFGVNFNSSSVCSSRGSCVLPQTCSCSSSEYYGNNCQYFNCSGIVNTSPQVCSSHGVCSSPDNCKCSNGYFGNTCELYNCSGIGYNSTQVCSSRGLCVSPDNCKCNSGYFGIDCEMFACSGVNYTSPKTCSSHGKCTLPDRCECSSVDYFGGNCELFNCSGIVYTSPNVCSSHGSCIEVNNCSCSTGYYGSECEHYQCNGIHFNSSQVCSSRGVCSSPDTCKCSEGYYGNNCEQFNCSGIHFNSSSVCSSHGSCILPQTCNCSSAYYGNNCQSFNCSGIVNNSPQVCSSNGICSSPETCKCSNGYYGISCEFFNCFGIEHSNSTVCSGNGKCQLPDSCKCNENFQGSQCEAQGKCVTVNNATICSESSRVSLSTMLSISLILSLITLLF